MSENTIKFIHEYNGEKVEITLLGGTTWMDVLKYYLQFLKCCDYAITAHELADYFSEMEGE